jgi:Xaa-Pro aminopeptidase
MRTVQPSIIIGSYTWDQERLPRDEFQIRIAALHRVMDDNGWSAVLLYGDASEHSALTYFTNFVPRLRWAMGLIPRHGEPRLLASMSPRDVPAMKLMTWIPDLLSGWNWESGFDPWLARLDAAEPVDIGTVGFDMMRRPLMQSLEKSLGNRFRLQQADAAVAACRTARPRELSQMREAAALTRAAADAFFERWRQDRRVEAAALAAERHARIKAAQDVRTLVSYDGGRTLGPFRGMPEATADNMLGYIAVKHKGYWADMFVSVATTPSAMQQHAHAALDALLRSAAPGLAAGEMHAAAMAKLGLSALHPMLGGSVGHRTGLSLDAGGALTADSSHTLQPGEVYALHVGGCDAAGGAIASAMVAVTATSIEILHRVPALSA